MGFATVSQSMNGVFAVLLLFIAEFNDSDVKVGFIFPPDRLMQYLDCKCWYWKNIALVSMFGLLLPNFIMMKWFVR